MQNFGIDISVYQGDFDIAKAKSTDGILFVISKIGGSDSGRYKDSRFDSNYAKCKNIGMPIGAYYFGGDKTVESAKQSAAHLISLLNGKQFEYPIYYDVEGAMLNLDKTLLNQIIYEFCYAVEKAGYYSGVYSTSSAFSNKITDTRFTHWVACWGKTKPSSAKDLWQFGGETNLIRSNKINGITVDQDYCYTDFPTIIKQKGLNGYGKDVEPNPSDYVMTSDEYVSKLISLVNQKTYYSNKYPNNLGYIHEDHSKSFDCWNMIKALINGYDVNRTDVGYYQKDLSVTGDVDGLNLLNKCTTKSTDFSKISKAGTYLFMRNTHSGTYVGEYNIGGKVVNCIECTAAWTKNVLWSFVDEKGRRYNYKGGSQCGTWTDWGLLPWIDYTDAKTPDPVDDKTYPNIASPTLQKGNKNSEVKKLQTNLNSFGYHLVVDGDFGGKTYDAVCGFQKIAGLTATGIYDNATYDKMCSILG